VIHAVLPAAKDKVIDLVLPRPPKSQGDKSAEKSFFNELWPTCLQNGRSGILGANLTWGSFSRLQDGNPSVVF